MPLLDMYGKNLTFKIGGVDGCDCEETLKLIAEGKINTEPLITHTYPLAKIDEAYELFENKRDVVIKGRGGVFIVGGSNMDVEKSSQNIVYDIVVDGDRSSYTSAIEDAIEGAKSEIETLYETTKSLDGLKPECDKLDYALAVGSGALCGIMDIFLVGKPGESPLGDITDKWFENRTKDFAKMCGWKDGEGKDASSAIRYLEKKFKIPYDQRGTGDIGSKIFGLSPENHHFKSLGHNPSLLGLFFSILDQFNNESHFVSNGMMISLQQADGKF